MSHVGDPALYGGAIVPSDVTVFASPTRSIYVGVTGNITVRMYGGKNNITFANVPVGILPVQADMVLSAGTAASSLVALW